MELRILINDCGEQFAGISKDHLCDFQDGVLYQFPFPVRYGQLESIDCSFTEGSPNGLVASNRFTVHRMLYCIMVGVKSVLLCLVSPCF